MSWSSLMEVHSKSFTLIGISMPFWGKFFFKVRLAIFFNGILDCIILTRTLDYWSFCFTFYFIFSPPAVGGNKVKLAALPRVIFSHVSSINLTQIYSQSSASWRIIQLPW